MAELKYYDVQQTADIIGVSTDTIFRWLKSGKLESYKVGRLRRISAQQIEDFMARMNENHGGTEK